MEAGGRTIRGAAFEHPFSNFVYGRSLHGEDPLGSVADSCDNTSAYVIGERERANLVVHLAAILYNIYTRRMHGIVGERERSNCVVDMRCI